MIIDELSSRGKPEIAIREGTTLDFILGALKDTCSNYKKAKGGLSLHKPLNENEMTQVFVEQMESRIKPHPFVAVGREYLDVHQGSKGRPDFYFYQIEEGVSHKPLFIVEAKRLPSPSFETEYVIGDKRNGAIERYKLEIHGKGSLDCGILGFIDSNTCKHWNDEVNKWIEAVASLSTFWENDEKVIQSESAGDYCYLKSIAHTSSSHDIRLHHIWVCN